MNRIFKRTDILLPSDGTNLSRWSVIACDQHTSEPEYWQELEQYVGDAPSTLRMMLPEAYLNRYDSDRPAAVRKINETMEYYLDSGLFRTLSDSYVYLERTLPGGAVRRGLVGAVDLDAYDYAPGSASPIRATEGTVEERLPPRVLIRSGAPLELPHVMVFINDPDDSVLRACSELLQNSSSVEAAAGPDATTAENRPEPSTVSAVSAASAVSDDSDDSAASAVSALTAAASCFEDASGRLLYDFDLHAGGGHLKGWQLTGKAADSVDSALDRLFAASGTGVLMAIGDGNHSLAAAKKCGDRYALVEVVNIHDPAVVFEPIHRVVFDTDPSDFIRTCGSQLLSFSRDGLCYGELVSAAEQLCRDYIAEHGGKIDYIHNDDTARAMGSRENSFAVLLPPLDKAALFESVERNGPYPKKSFSIGLADEKRFYLECRQR